MSSPESSDYHAEELVKHCRVCGKRFPRGGRKFDKISTTTKSLIASCYDVQTENDNKKVHPPEVCHACIAQMRRIKTAQGTAILRTDSSLFQWEPHMNEECSICDHFRSMFRGGRPKQQQPMGRQSGEPASCTLEALCEVTGATLVGGISASRLVSSHIQESHVICVLCNAIVDAPIQLSCDRLVCHPCIRSHIIKNGQICPGCQQLLDSTHVSKCTCIVQSLIRHLRVKCKFECQYPITLEQLPDHEATCSQVSHTLSRGSLIDMTIGEIMEIPLTAPLSCDEEFLCSRLVRRATQGGKDLVIPTGGQVHCTHATKYTKLMKSHRIYIYTCTHTKLNHLKIYTQAHKFTFTHVDPHIPAHSASSSTFIGSI